MLKKDIFFGSTIMADKDLLKGRYRWGLILSAFIIMMIISIYQYSWFLFAYAIKEKFGWDLATIGLTFTIFTYTATFIQPFSGYIADSYSPKKIALISCIVVGLGFIFSSFATSPLLLYVFYGSGGLAVGVLYGISTACAIKWFPDRRGFATGLVVFGFGAGTAIFNIFIQHMLEIWGLRATFQFLGFSMILLLLPLSLFYKYPSENVTSTLGNALTSKGSEFKPREMMGTYQWYLIYFSFTCTVSVVLLFGAQMKMLANEFSIPANYFSFVHIIFPLGNGLSRVVSGAISDKIGREKTMMLFYSLLGLSILCFVASANVPILFVATVFIASMLGGSPFALYPSVIGDYYGTGYATTNYGFTYTAKAWAGLISGWLSGYLAIQFGSYRVILIFLAIGSLIAAAISNPKLMKPPQKR
jgi:OFA family oxalate/formate antiporter-like MFS transporter